MVQVVEPILPGVEFGPNGADPVFVWLEDQGIVVLALAPHFDDDDQRHVVLIWSDAMAARMGAPNDEGRHRHPDLGTLAVTVSWIGEVHESRWIASLAPSVAGAMEGQRHFLVLDKESTFEVMAAAVQVLRLPGPSHRAAWEACEAATR